MLTVGDEFQSIYRFRNADLEVFRRARRRRGRPATATSPAAWQLPLAAGDRRRRQLGRAARSSTASARCPPDGEPGRRARAVELRLTLDEGERRATAAGAPKGSSSSPRPSAPRAKVSRRRGRSPSVFTSSPRPGDPRGDIVVLLRAFTHVDAYEEALERAGLARSSSAAGAIGPRSRSRTCCACSGDRQPARRRGALRGARVVRLRREPGRPVAAARGGRGAASLSLARARLALRRRREPARYLEGEPLDAPIDDEDRARRSLPRHLGELRAEAPTLPLDALIDRDDLRLRLRPGAAHAPRGPRPDGERAQADAPRRGVRDARGPGPARLYLLRRGTTARDEREGQAALQAEEHDGVRVMTVHAAKGLEFPVVAVADLGRRLAGGRAGDLVIGRFAGDGLRERTSRSACAWRCRRRNRFGSGSWSSSRTRTASGRRGGLPPHLRRRHPSPEEADPERRVRPGEARGAGRTRCRGDTALRRFLPALHELGWGGGEGLVAIPPAEGVQPAGHAGDRSDDHRAGPERAAELAAAATPPPEAERSRSRARRPRSRAGPRLPPAVSPTRRSPRTSAAATASTSSACSARANRRARGPQQGAEGDDDEAPGGGGPSRACPATWRSASATPCMRGSSGAPGGGGRRRRPTC